ncbi:hypothetical protein RHMOL_Rhmol02G0281300 [Rhododendron molle]|uniref:Uncharacterized protein n=1 Tax=Rhododendron molle TaxID=49168 RepID=A0ACC0PWD1_RHOML|nr:hypothetical protein RHMOL_Rhmol02G0281300 [Rhododendron molle]
MARERESERERVRERVKGKDQDEGGWIPVIKNQRARANNGDRTHETYTLFVDNIPEDKDLQWLQRTFNKFGVVKDAFIPWKRSKRTGNRFGFVRFDCHISASMAVSRLNGLWVEDKKLFVKEACFGRIAKLKEPRTHERREHQQTDHGKNKKVVPSGQVWNSMAHGRSFAHVVNGESSKQPSPNVSLQINPTGNGWLFRSAVAVMRRVVPLLTLRASCELEMDKSAQFRALGGRSVLVTFQSQEARDVFIKDPWMERWFEVVKPWSGEPASHERFAWLGCQGIPLNAWDNTTFHRIGEIWGHFVSVHEETLRSLCFAQGKILIATEEKSKIEQWIQLVVQGVKYDVLVKEISSFVNPDEAEIPRPMILAAPRPTPKSQEKVGNGSGAKGAVEEDDDVETISKGPANEKGGVGEGAGVSVSDSAIAYGKEKTEARVGGPKQPAAGEHLMFDERGIQSHSEDFESLVEESVGHDNDLGPLAHLEFLVSNKAQQKSPARDGTMGQSGADKKAQVRL